MKTATAYKGDLYGVTINLARPATISCYIHQAELVELRETADPESTGDVYVRLPHGSLIKRTPEWRSTREDAAADIARSLRQLIEQINEKILELTLEEVGV